MLTNINNNNNCNNNSYNNCNNNSYNNNSYNSINSLLFRVFYNLCCILSPKEEEK